VVARFSQDADQLNDAPPTSVSGEYRLFQTSDASRRATRRRGNTTKGRRTSGSLL
jgi:hypothetical protein